MSDSAFISDQIGLFNDDSTINIRRSSTDPAARIQEQVDQISPILNDVQLDQYRSRLEERRSPIQGISIGL